jgi:hypothetical protein
MHNIYKYPFDITDEQYIEIPQDPEFLCAQVQGEQPCIWAKVDPTSESQLYRVRVIGTGHDINDDPGEYLDTIQIQGGSLILHVFIHPGM